MNLVTGKKLGSDLHNEAAASCTAGLTWRWGGGHRCTEAQCCLKSKDRYVKTLRLHWLVLVRPLAVCEASPWFCLAPGSEALASDDPLTVVLPPVVVLLNWFLLSALVLTAPTSQLPGLQRAVEQARMVLDKVLEGVRASYAATVTVPVNTTSHPAVASSSRVLHSLLSFPGLEPQPPQSEHGAGDQARGAGHSQRARPQPAVGCRLTRGRHLVHLGGGDLVGWGIGG